MYDYTLIIKFSAEHADEALGFKTEIELLSDKTTEIRIQTIDLTVEVSE